MAGDNTTLDLDLLVPEDRIMRLKEVEYPVDGLLSVEDMIALYRSETRLTDLLASDDDNEADLADEIEHGNELVLGIVRRRTPDATLSLNLKQLLIMLAWLAGEVSVSDAIAKAVSAGMTGAKTADEVDPEKDADAGGEEQTGEGTAPFESETHSLERSSGSDSSIAGPPSIGGDSPGERSAPTSSTLTPV